MKKILALTLMLSSAAEQNAFASMKIGHDKFTKEVSELLSTKLRKEGIANELESTSDAAKSRAEIILHPSFETPNPLPGYRTWVMGRSLVGVFVHESNPIPSITLDALFQVYHQHDKGEPLPKISTWDALLPGHPWKGAKIELLNCHENHGAVEFFSRLVLKGGRFDDDCEPFRFSAGQSLVTLSKSARAITFVDFSLYKRKLLKEKLAVKPLPVATRKEVAAAPEDAARNLGRYPLTRYDVLISIRDAKGELQNKVLAALASRDLREAADRKSGVLIADEAKPL